MTFELTFITRQPWETWEDAFPGDADRASREAPERLRQFPAVVEAVRVALPSAVAHVDEEGGSVRDDDAGILCHDNDGCIDLLAKAADEDHKKRLRALIHEIA